MDANVKMEQEAIEGATKSVAQECEWLLLSTISSAHQIFATLQHLSSNDLPKVNYKHIRADLEVAKAKKEDQLKKEYALNHAKKVEKARQMEVEMLMKHKQQNEAENKWECANCDYVQLSVIMEQVPGSKPKQVTTRVCGRCQAIREKHERKFLPSHPEVYDVREPCWRCSTCQKSMPAGLENCLIHREIKRPPGTIQPFSANVPISRVFFERVSSQLKQDMKVRLQALRLHKHQYSNRQHRLGEALKKLDGMQMSNSSDSSNKFTHMDTCTTGSVASEMALLRQRKENLTQDLMLQNDVLKALVAKIMALQRDVALCLSTGD